MGLAAERALRVRVVAPDPAPNTRPRTQLFEA